MTTLKKAAIAISIQAALFTSIQVTAATNDDEKIEQITVTALKRTQTIQEVPASVVAIPPENISDFLGAGENIRALAGRVPSLQIESSNGRQSPRFYIRGLGNTDFDVNASQPVSLVLDEVALENSVLKSIPLFDLDRVEVLSGPQGTLFGRNTPAGIVKIETKAPDFYDSGYLSGGFGSRGTKFVEGAYNKSVSSDFAARASIKYQERDPWIDNVVRNEEVGGYEELAYRIQGLWEKSQDTKILFKIHGFEQDGDMPQVFYGNGLEQGKKGVRAGFDETVIYHDTASGFDMSHFGGSLRVEHTMGDIDIVSVTGYDTVDSFQFTDVDGADFGSDRCNAAAVENALIGCNTTPHPWFFVLATGDGLSDHYQFTQEFRASTTLDNTFVQGGVYYFQEDYTVDNKGLNKKNQTTEFTQVDQLTTSYAIFGQAEHLFTDELAVTLGLRYTWDDKELDIRPIDLETGNTITENSTSNKKDDSYLNWDLSARYTINKDWTAFARVGNASRGPVTIGRFGFYSEADTETLTSYEAGLKSVLLDGNLRWNLTAYTYDIEDHQLTATGGEANTNSLLNADNTKGSGIETDLVAYIGEGLKVTYNLSYNKTEIQDKTLGTEPCSSVPLCTVQDNEIRDGIVGVNGNPLPRSPEWMSNIILNYETEFKDGYIYAQTDWNYRSDSNIFLYEAPEFTAESRWLGGLRLGYKTDEGFDVALVGRNITNEIVVDGALDFINLTTFINEPSYWGLEVRMEFE